MCRVGPNSAYAQYVSPLIPEYTGVYARSNGYTTGYTMGVYHGVYERSNPGHVCMAAWITTQLTGQDTLETHCTTQNVGCFHIAWVQLRDQEDGAKGGQHAKQAAEQQHNFCQVSHKP